MKPIRLLYIHQYFRTPDQGSSSRSWYFTHALAEKGHYPIVITAHNEPSYKCRKYDGVEVHYLPVYYDNALSFPLRIRAFLNFVRKSLALIRTLPKADLAYILSTPLTTGLIGLYLKVFHKTPYLFDVADLWPRAPIEIGAIKNPLVKKGLYLLEKKIYLQAERVVALSPAIEEDILARVPSVPTLMIPNMADLDFFADTAGLKDKDSEVFDITYFGAAGLANHLEYLIEAAKEIEEAKLPVRFTIVAEGARLAAIKDMVVERHLQEYVRFYDYMPKKQLKRLLSQSDAVYISFKNLPVLETGSPNKFFDGLAAGKMIIANFEGWIGELIRANSLGFTYPPEEPHVFVSKLRPYLENPHLAREAGQNSRRLAEEHFSRREHTARFVTLIEQTIQSRSGR